MQADKSALPERFVQLCHNRYLQKNVHWISKWQKDTLLSSDQKKKLTASADPSLTWIPLKEKLVPSLKLVLFSYCASFLASRYTFPTRQSILSFDGLVTWVHSFTPWQDWTTTNKWSSPFLPRSHFLHALRVMTVLELVQLFWVGSGKSQVYHISFMTGRQTSDLCYLECDREPTWPLGEHWTLTGQDLLAESVLCGPLPQHVAHTSMHDCIRQLSMASLQCKYIESKAIDNGLITYLLQP